MKNGFVALVAVLTLTGQVAPASAHYRQVREPSVQRFDEPMDDARSNVRESDDENRLLTRADFVGGIVAALYGKEDIESCFWDITSPLPPRFTLVFTDVHVDHPAAKHLCVALRDGLVRLGDGNFRPNDKITMAEAGKVFSRAFFLAPYAELDPFSPWYKHHLVALANLNVIPLNITSLTQFITAADAAEMLDRLMERDRNEPGTTYEELVANTFGTKKPASKPVTPSSAASSSSAGTSSRGTDDADADEMMQDGKGE